MTAHDAVARFLMRKKGYALWLRVNCCLESLQYLLASFSGEKPVGLRSGTEEPRKVGRPKPDGESLSYRLGLTRVGIPHTYNREKKNAR